ncbi:MAG: PAC2 family protein, partial [Methanomassiliicoccaceae archaeon]|nr:PAC2 family protein [Methanomassiliicoccaceae archaeon]
VSSIAAGYLAKTLELEFIGCIGSPEFPPYAVVQNGIPLPPLRFYGGSRNCDVCTGLESDGLIVVTSEFMPKVEQHHQLASSLMDWFAENRVSTVICLEGVLQFEAADAYEISAVGSTPEANDLIDRYSIKRLQDSLVRGTTGVMLYEGAMRRMNVIAMLSSAKVDMPDPRGAARLMEPLVKMFPEMKIDMRPLYKDAEEIERHTEPHHSGGGDNDILYG